MYDVIIVGAGVVGLCTARELSRYRLSVCVVEKKADVAMGVSKANSAIIHAGFDAKPGTLKARFNVEGSRLYKKLSEDLKFKYRNNGSLVLCFNPSQQGKLWELYRQGEKNAVSALEIIDRKTVLELEPSLNPMLHSALLAEGSGIVCPYGMAAALAENAYQNGVEFFFNNAVVDIKKEKTGFIVHTEKALLETKILINCAGLHSDELNNMVSGISMKIKPRRGEYCVFDKYANEQLKLSHTIFQLPSERGKGVLVTPTVDGNLLTGPNADDVDDKDDTAVTFEGIAEIIEKGKLSIPQLPVNQIIHSFSGLRARTLQDNGKDDFILGESEDTPGFINAVGIESPGLTSAPALGVYLSEMVAEKLQPMLNSSFCGIRRSENRFAELAFSDLKEKLCRDKALGNIICRCEQVSESEILEAIHRIPGARTMDGIKIRTRAGMGRCQGGFCSTRVMKLLSTELGIPETEITKHGDGSYLLMQKKGGRDHGVL